EVHAWTDTRSAIARLLPRDSSIGARPVRPSTATTRPRPSTIANVSGTAVRDRDPPIGDFFPKNRKAIWTRSSHGLAPLSHQRAASNLSNLWPRGQGLIQSCVLAL